MEKEIFPYNLKTGASKVFDISPGKIASFKIKLAAEIPVTVPGIYVTFSDTFTPFPEQIHTKKVFVLLQILDL